MKSHARLFLMPFALFALMVVTSSCEKEEENKPENSAPIASFTINPESGSTSTMFNFDASASSDQENSLNELVIRWDFEGDNNWDTDWATEKTVSYQYSSEGIFSPTLEVKDTEGLTNSESKDVEVTNVGVDGEPCPGTPTVTDADGNVYNTVLIGDQCWMKENLNVGLMILGNEDVTDNDTIEKHCYDDNELSCDEYGGLYQWNEMMQYTEGDIVQGICPQGWHIPNAEEWITLEGYVDSLYTSDDPEWTGGGYRGYDAGKNLKAQSGWNENGNGTDLFGFSALPGGFKNQYGGFYRATDYGKFWVNKKAGSGASWYRQFDFNRDKVLRANSIDVYGFSVRCIKD